MNRQQWDELQGQLFEQWINSYLMKRGLSIEGDLLSALSDGVLLPQLLEIISGESLKYIKHPRFPAQRIDNISVALTFMETHLKVKVLGCSPQGISDKNSLQIMGLLFCLMQRVKERDREQSTKGNINSEDPKRIFMENIRAPSAPKLFTDPTTHNLPSRYTQSTSHLELSFNRKKVHQDISANQRKNSKPSSIHSENSPIQANQNKKEPSTQEKSQNIDSTQITQVVKGDIQIQQDVKAINKTQVIENTIHISQESSRVIEPILQTSQESQTTKFEEFKGIEPFNQAENIPQKSIDNSLNKQQTESSQIIKEEIQIQQGSIQNIKDVHKIEESKVAENDTRPQAASIQVSFSSKGSEDSQIMKKDIQIQQESIQNIKDVHKIEESKVEALHELTQELHTFQQVESISIKKESSQESHDSQKIESSEILETNTQTQGSIFSETLKTTEIKEAKHEQPLQSSEDVSQINVKNQEKISQARKEIPKKLITHDQIESQTLLNIQKRSNENTSSLDSEILKEKKLSADEKTQPKNETNLPSKDQIERERRISETRSKRDDVVHEIIETERIYVKNLDTLHKIFIVPLRQLGDEVLSLTDFKQIFSEIEVIRKTNSTMLQDLEERMKTWNSGGPQKIGDIFLVMTDFLKAYTVYVNNYNLAFSTLNRCMKNSKFATFVEKAKKEPECELWDLSTFLIIPIQRIPRYVLLLQDLVRHTPPQHVDYEDLEKALNKMRDVALYMNERKREAENLNQVLEIQELMIGKFDNLCVPYRRYIRKGHLIMNDSELKYYNFLFNDILVITKPQPRSIKFKSKQDLRGTFKEDLESLGLLFKFKESLPLETSSLLDVSEGNKFAFLLETPTKSYTMTALSFEEHCEWMNDIDDAISHLTEKLVSRHVPIKPPSLPEFTPSILRNPSIEGILWKQHKSSWKQKYFVLKNNALYYFPPENRKDLPKVIQLQTSFVVKVCLIDREFCFQLMTPSRIYYLCAESHKLMFEWVYHIRKAILNLLKESDKKLTESKTPTEELLQKILDDPDNQICADCSKPKPSWIDVGLGVIICTECSGIHRRLGPRSSVKSMNFGTFKSASLLQKIKNINNRKSNEKYASNIKNHPSIQKPNPDSSHAIKSHWIKAKYLNQDSESSGPIQCEKQGFLFRKIDNIDEWKRNYFVLKNDKLMYSKDLNQEDATVIDLKLSSIMQSSLKDFSFDLQTPTRIFTLAAESKEEMESWLEALIKALTAHK